MSLTDAERKFNLCVNRIRRAMTAWIPSEAQPTCWSDLKCSFRPTGRPTKLTKEQEEMIADGVKYFAENKTPLSKHGIRAFVEQYVSLLPLVEQEKIGFNNNVPSMRWTKSFADRNGLSYRKVQQVEDARVKAVTEGNVVEHIARIQAAFNRYNIKSPSQVVNMDQSCMIFKKMVGKSLRKGFVDSSKSKNNIALQRTWDSKGGLDRVTLMPAVTPVVKLTLLVLFTQESSLTIARLTEDMRP